MSPAVLLAVAVAAGPSAGPSATPATAPAPPASSSPGAPQAADAAPSDTVRADTLPRGAVRGRVTSSATGGPVPSALVEVRTESSYHMAMTDAQGHYELAGVPSGDRRLRAVALGFGELEVGVQVPEGRALSLELSLNVRPVGLPSLGVVTTGGPGGAGVEVPGAPAPRGSPADPERQALQSAPGVAELGLLDAVRQAQRSDPGDPSGSLWVRGATSDLRRVLLDGAPVYAPFHLGGLMDAVPSGLLGSARLYLGGAPARYDGGLSYVLDLETRPGRADRVRWSGEVDMLHGSSRLEGPLGPWEGASFLLAGRSTHGVGGDELVDGDLPYGYRDGVMRFEVPTGDDGRLALTGFANRESVSLSGSGLEAGRAEWGNDAGSLRYTGPLAGAHVSFTAATGRFRTRLPMGDDASGLADGEARQTRVVAAARSRSSDELGLRYGLSWNHTRTLVAAGENAVGPDGIVDGETEPLRAAGRTASAWAGAAWRPEEVVEVRFGLRGDYFTAGSEVRASPRVALAWLPSESSRLTVSAGRYSQYVRVPESILSGDLDEWTEPLTADAAGASTGTASRLLSVSSADHLVVGMEHRADHELALGMEAFFKDFDGLVPGGSLRAAGTDLWVDWRDDGWAAWGGYSLAFVWNEGRPSTVGAERFSGRQTLTAGVGVPLPSGVRFEGRVAAGSGLPFEAVPISGAPARLSSQQTQPTTTQATTESPFLSGAPDGSHLRLDLEISRSWPVSVLGTEVRIAPYLRMLNALDTRDALFYHFQEGEDLQPQSLDSVPFLPVVGVRWEG